ncbi:DNA polymerase III subunit gamma/tau [Microbacterium sp. HD4P20]|uniref:DNA polymerase III subunit gamma/tau n=1 Tax=Microbacterium sp. HD4P20 TaxID=2864874 RepID=UPI001C6447CB|nr:DNA polymerase III subunit gamma/tau [Microbacterium sp. HD4P20]MCP2636623.1 DNA polymerase III subunit gamma/tau [Microbacterium sp. HD4P20]
MSGRDDDALSWSGDDDPTLDAGSPTAAGEPQATPALPDGYVAVGRGSESLAEEPVGAGDGDEDDHRPEVPVEDAAPRAAMRSAELITLGVLGGVYALFAIGWLIGGLRLQGHAQYLVFDVMYQGSLWLAVLAPVLWFATTFLLTRGARSWVRFAWLAAGVVLLLPWPFVMIGAVGQ